MKNLELNQMERVKGNGPCFNTTACAGIALAANFFAPAIGGIAIGVVCWAFVECDGETDAGTEWW